MSQPQQLEVEISKLPNRERHLVRECAHELQQVLDRYQRAGQAVPPVSLALDLVLANQLDTLRY